MSFLQKIFGKRRSGADGTETPRAPFRMSGGTMVTPETAMQVSAFHRGVMYIATQVAKLPWHVKNEDNKTLNRHAISHILKTAANEEMSSFHFRIYMVICCIVYGNGYAEIERDKVGRIIGLWPIKPLRVQPDRTVNGKLIYRVSAGQYDSEGREVEVILNPRDIFHLKSFHSWDGIVGENIPFYASETLGTSMGADRFANSLFANGGTPSGVLTTQGKLSEEAYKRLKTQWDENQSGRKVGGTALLEEGLKYETITMEPEVMQFLASRKFSVIEIARFLGLPPTKLFDTDVATYSNQEQSNLEVATDTLDAWARNFESEADIKLLNFSYGGLKTEMDLYAIFRGDMAARSTYFTKIMGTGAITPNEIRRKEGMEPYPEGDKFYIATNNFTPVDKVDALLEAQIQKNTAAPAAKPKEDDSEEEVNEAIIDYLKTRAGS